ncbi:hypothetical protein SBADM41S_12110 [Streptomyces badius]
MLERLRAIQVVDSFFVPRPLQEAALELVGSPSWGHHLAAVATELRHRRTALATALGGELPELVLPHLPAGGGSLWLRLPGGGAGDSADRPSYRPPCGPRSPSPPVAPTSAPNPRADTSA